jgi:hypothetical protein
MYARSGGRIVATWSAQAADRLPRVDFGAAAEAAVPRACGSGEASMLSRRARLRRPRSPEDSIDAAVASGVGLRSGRGKSSSCSASQACEEPLPATRSRRGSLMKLSVLVGGCRELAAQEHRPKAGRQGSALAHRVFLKPLAATAQREATCVVAYVRRRRPGGISAARRWVGASSTCSIHRRIDASL